MAQGIDALLSAQEALLEALAAGAPAERLTAAGRRCALALEGLTGPVPRADLLRARQLALLLQGEAGRALAATGSELAKLRRMAQHLDARREAERSGGSCDVSG